MPNSESVPLINECYGIVVLVDFLGVSLFNNEECIRFLKVRNKIMDHIDESGPFLKKQTGPLGKSLPKDFKISSFAFGDNLLIAINLGKETLPGADKNSSDYYKSFAIAYILQYISRSFVFSLENRYLFRGAISIGDFIESRNNENDVSVIGEAVADAASWHEKTDWGGIIFTPKASIYLDGCQYGYEKLKKIDPDEKLKKTQKYNYSKYEVPFKDGTKDMWVVSWPFVLLTEFRCFDKITALDYIHSVISNMNIVFGRESKFLNTLEFAKQYLENINDAELSEYLKFQESYLNEMKK